MLAPHALQSASVPGHGAVSGVIPLNDENLPTSRPVITLGLMIALGCVFIWELALDPTRREAAMHMFGVTPALLFGNVPASALHAQVPVWLTPVSAMFLHGGVLHLAGNLLYLWIFGDNVEDAMGRIRFILFYLSCGAIAAWAHAATAPDSMIPMIGASGAISGVLGAYLVLYPNARVLVLIPLGLFAEMVYLPAVVVLGFWFLLQIVSAHFADAGAPGVAWMAHVAGFAAGIALLPLFKDRGGRRGRYGRPRK